MLYLMGEIDAYGAEERPEFLQWDHGDAGLWLILRVLSLVHNKQVSEVFLSLLKDVFNILSYRFMILVYKHRPV